MRKFLPNVIFTLLIVIFTLSIVIFFLFMLLMILREDVNIPILFATAVIFAVMFLFYSVRIRYQAFLNQQKKMDILLQQCDPNKLLEILCKQVKQKKPQALLNASMCHAVLGDYTSAMSLVASVSPAARKRSPGWDFLCHNRFFNCYLMQNNLEAARQELDYMQAILLAKQAAPSSLYGYNVLYLQNYYDLNIKIGVFEGALQFYLALLSIEKSLLSKIEIHYYIALIHAGQHNLAAAREALNFVIANGNKTVYVSVAQELLAELGQQSV